MSFSHNNPKKTVDAQISKFDVLGVACLRSQVQFMIGGRAFIGDM